MQPTTDRTTNFLSDGYVVLPRIPSETDSLDKHHELASRLIEIQNKLECICSDLTSFSISSVNAIPLMRLDRNNGFIRLTLDINFINLLSHFPADALRLLSEGQIGFGWGKYDSDSEKMTVLSYEDSFRLLNALIPYASACFQRLLANGFDEEFLMSGFDDDSYLAAALTYYDRPKVRVNGQLDDKEDSDHRDTGIKNGVSATEQLSSDPTDFALGATRDRIAVVRQDQGDRILMNCLVEGTGATRIIHEPEVTGPRSAFLYSVTGPAACDHLHGLDISVPLSAAQLPTAAEQALHVR